MKKLLFFLASTLSAAITNVRVEPSFAQAVIFYTAPTTAACSVQVWDMNLQSDESGPKATTQIATTSGSGSTVTVTTVLAHGLRTGRVYLADTGVPDWDGPKTVVITGTHTFTFSDGNAGDSTGGNVGMLVHDVNTDLFSGSDLDSRASANSSGGKNRIFVAGTRGVGTPAGGRVTYSRALQNNARHLYRITCGGDTHEGEFRTKNIPLGYLAIDYPQPETPGGPIQPTFETTARWDKATGVYMDRVIDPVTGSMYTQMDVPELIVDTAFAVSTSNTPTPIYATNWSNPGNVRTQDGSNATYAAATQDVICIQPYSIMGNNGANKAQWFTQNLSLENIIVTLRGSGATGASADNRSVGVALSRDWCQTAATEYRQVTLPETSLGNVTFPSGTAQGAFADWHSATQRPFKHLDVYTQQSYLNTSGTAVTWVPDTTFGSGGNPGVSLFNTNWLPGTKILIGTSTPCTTGTAYTIASVTNARNLVIEEDAGTLTNQRWCVQQFGIMIRKWTTSTDQIDLDYATFTLREARTAAIHFSGSAKIFGEKPVTDANGNVGYLSYNGTQGGNPNAVRFTSQDNGETRFILGFLNSLPGISGEVDAGSCAAIENSFSSTEPDAFFCLMSKTGGGRSIVEFKLWQSAGTEWQPKAVSGSPWSVCTTTSPVSPDPCLQPINKTGSYSLLDLIEDRNPLYDQSKFPGCGLRGIQSHYMYVTCQRSIQDTIAWWVMVDLDKPIGSYDPMDQSTNPVVAAMSTTNAVFRGWAGYHTGFVMPGGDTTAVFDPKFLRKNEATDRDGAGPFRMAIVGDAALNNTTDVSSCPANRWNYTNCSTIHVTSEPYDPDPGPTDSGAAGEFGTMAVGNGLRFFKCDPMASAYVRETITENVANSGCITYANDEYGRILAISGTAPDITLTVARGITASGMKNHAAGWSLYQWTQTDRNTLAVDVNMVWDFLNCPTGDDLDCANYAGGGTSHGSLSKYAAVGYSYSADSGLAQVAWPNPTAASYKGTPAVNLNIPFFVWPTYAGKFGFRFAGPVQRYNANNHVDFDPARENAFRFYMDSRPHHAGAYGPAYHYAFEKVSGATYLYQYKQQVQGDRRLPWIKHLSFMIESERKTLVDKSGPSSSLADNSGDHYKKCIAWAANECVSGSKFGDIFVNLPYATSSTSDYICGGYGTGEQDICAGPVDPMIGPEIQFWFGSGPNMGRGRHIRKLGWGMRETQKNASSIPTPKVGPNGKWLGPLWTAFANDHRSGGTMMKLAPIPAEDGYDRTTFVPVPLSVGSVPAGMSVAVAQVEYGYAFHGTPAQLYCSERRESCLATNEKVIGDSAVSNVWTTLNQNGSWQYTWTTLTSGTPYTLTFSSPHKFSSDLRVRATTQTTNSNYYKGWPINITSPTVVELVGSNAGDIGAGGTVTSMVEKIEAPFAYSGESIAVAGATNASPIEITTATRSTFQTGSRVCISGVGGNTAANGCWQITATGPSAFTLTGSTGNGSYTSGGTVTPGGVPCTSSCTVVVPGRSGHVLHYRWRYLDSTGALVATGNTNTTVVP